jgi:hypothetical protein
MLTQRLAIYKKIEESRGRPLLVFITSMRQNAAGQISGDSVAEFQNQLQLLPKGTKALDLLLVSTGGDPTVAWRIVSLIRERVDEFSVLVPQAAYSAATLIVLGADEIVMHPNGNLGPTDPQITAPKPGNPQNERQSFGSEDLAAFLKYAKDTVGLKDEAHVAQVYRKFIEDVGSLAVGVAARSSLLSVSMGEKLLQLHMKGEAQGKKARTIAERLTKDFFHHGYPLNRTEADEIGLKVTKPDPAVEDLMWEAWLDLSEDLKLRTPFNAVGLVRSNSACAPLFAPVPTVNIPAGLPPDVMSQVVAGVLQQVAVQNVPGTEFETLHALMESPRLASRFATRGLIFAMRQSDLTFKVSSVVDHQGWETAYTAPPKVKPKTKAKAKA